MKKRKIPLYKTKIFVKVINYSTKLFSDTKLRIRTVPNRIKQNAYKYNNEFNVTIQ